MYLFALLYLLEIYEIPPLIPFSINKCMSISEIRFNFIAVIFNIVSQLNPGLLKNNKDLIHNNPNIFLINFS